MSNSAKAKLRRSNRSRTTKHQRTVMASRHFGIVSNVKRTKVSRSKSISGGLSAIEQKMKEMRSKL